MNQILALKVNDKDNVATVFSNQVCANTEIEVHDKKGRTWKQIAHDAIPYGHKLALEDIAKGDAIIKYGEELGRASKAIGRGEHVHLHNLESMRGRGDLQEN